MGAIISSIIELSMSLFSNLLFANNLLYLPGDLKFENKKENINKILY